MKILSIEKTIDNITFEPRINVVISIPLSPMTHLNDDETNKLIGESFTKAMEKYFVEGDEN